MRITKTMVTGLVVAISMLGCAQGPEEVPDQDWDAVSEEGIIPQAAAEIMAAVGGTSNVAPQFFGCPPYLTYEPAAMESSGAWATGWTSGYYDLFNIDTVEWNKYSNNIVLRCRTTQSPHFFMHVARSITGFNTCSTSNDTPQADGAWFVCF